MVDLQSILAEHRSKKALDSIPTKNGGGPPSAPNYSEIPDVLFDKIIIDFKLNRIEILVLIYIYRRVWCLPNLHRSHGISQMMSHTEMAKNMGMAIEDVYSALRKLEEYDMIRTIRAGQYFSRRFFSKEMDDAFNQTYDDFEL
jgi:hypothetical protein